MEPSRNHPTGYHDGQLAECPSRPNCVCSQSGLPARVVDPLPVPTAMNDPIGHLVTLLLAWPRVRVVFQDHEYVHLEFRTAWLRFVDDVEFYWDREAALLHVRSASRLGYSDLGVNRRRVERIRRLFDSA